MASIWDYADIFKTNFTFSNKISSSFGKFFTFSYLVLFLYMSISAILYIFIQNNIVVTTIDTYDQNFNTNNEQYYKRLNLILYLSIFTTSGGALNKSETLRVYNNFFQNQVSSIQSQNYYYQKKTLSSYACGQKENILIFCVDYDISNLHDFIFVSFSKNSILNEKDKEEFFSKYSMNVHVDYYFMDPCDNKVFFENKELEIFIKEKNKVFDQNKVLDYIRNTFGTYTIRINETFIKGGGKNILVNFKTIKLQLDSGVILSKKDYFNSFVFHKQDSDFSANILTMTFKLSPLVQIFQFKYKKIQESFAEIAGVMGFIKFLGVLFILSINFLKEHTFFSNTIFKRKVIFINSLHTTNGNKTPEKELKNNGSNKKQIFYNKVKKPTEENASGISENKTLERIHIFNKAKDSSNFEAERNIQNQPNNNSYTNVYKKYEGQIDGMFNLKDNLEFEPTVIRINTEIVRKNINTDMTQPKSSANRLQQTEMFEINRTKIERYIKSQQVINDTKFSICSIFSILVCGKCRKSKKMQNKLLVEMIFENMKKMDFFRIVKTQTRLDIMGYLLLSDRQREVMKFIEKEQAVYDKATNKVSFFKKYKNNYDKNKKVELIYDYCKSIKDNQCSEVDRKLFFLLDEDFTDTNYHRDN